jgi:hypothetical protein
MPLLAANLFTKPTAASVSDLAFVAISVSFSERRAHALNAKYGSVDDDFQ